MTDWFNNFEEPEKKEVHYMYVCKNKVKCNRLLSCMHKQLHEYDPDSCSLDGIVFCASNFKDSECVPMCRKSNG